MTIGAVDADASSPNTDIFYGITSVEPSEYEDMFLIDENSGEIKLISILDVETMASTMKIDIFAKDKGVQSLTTTSFVTIGITGNLNMLIKNCYLKIKVVIFWSKPTNWGAI